MIGKTNMGKMLGLVGLYRFSVARRLYVLRAMLARLSGDPRFAFLCGLIAEAIAFDEETLELEAELKRRGAPRRHEEGAMAVDREVNRALGGLAERLRAELAVFGEDHPVARSAGELLAGLFPEGVAAVTRLPFVEKSTQLGRIIGNLRAWSGAVHRFGLEAFRGRLEELYGSYVRLLGPRGRPEVTAELVAERERQGDAELRYLVVHILSAFGRPGVHDDGLCEELLGPILAQNEDLGALMKARRAGKKVKARLEDPLASEAEEEMEGEPAEESQELGAGSLEAEDREEAASVGAPARSGGVVAGGGAGAVLRRSSSSRRLRPSPAALRERRVDPGGRGARGFRGGGRDPRSVGSAAWSGGEE